MKNLLFSFMAIVLLANLSFSQGVLKGELKDNENTYKIFEESSAKYTNGKFQYNINVGKDFVFDEKVIDDKTTILSDTKGGTLKIEMISQTKNSITFNLAGSNGKTVKNLTYTSVNEISGKFCWKCVTILVSAGIGVISDMFGPGSDCAVAINACVKAGGIPSTTITSGFFGQDCTVTCNKK